jgi:high affinity choline transporter 7
LVAVTNLSLVGAASLGLFYALFLWVGIGVSKRNRDRDSQTMMLADRTMPLWLGTLTLIATWVGGGYINGSAENAYNPEMGLVWTQAPWCYALSLIVGGMFFAGKMRRMGLTTMLDLFDQRYGPGVASLLYIPCLLADLFWMAAILCALGTTCGTILGVASVHGIWISAVIAIAYTMRGGLWSVAYTDALQLACILVGLGIAIPFAAQAAGGFTEAWQLYGERYAETARIVPAASAWQGSMPWGWRWLDGAFLLVLGGIPWQVYFQRVLASRTPRAAVGLSMLAGIGCLLMAIPPICLGVFGATVDWSATASGPPAEAAMILPHVLRYLTPTWLAILGLAAVAAAVMSSMDSSLLATASQFAWNVYRPYRGRPVTETELRRVIRVGIVAVGVCATVLALSTRSVYTLWFLCADLVYVILFPQLVTSLYFARSTRRGAVAGVLVGAVMRVAGGEPSWGWPAWNGYPWPDGDSGTYFPHRTAAMLASLLTIILVSVLFPPAAASSRAAVK